MCTYITSSLADLRECADVIGGHQALHFHAGVLRYNVGVEFLKKFLQVSTHLNMQNILIQLICINIINTAKEIIYF